MDNKNNKLLIINDVTGYGRVSTMAMVPILSTCGIHPYYLPTSLVSNTMDYGSSEILDTTEFMRKAISKWDEFGFIFNYISTGFINSKEQVDIILSLIEKQNPAFVMVDPIMADDGKLYPGMYSGAIECNRTLISKSDLCIPNLTEAEMLADMYIGIESLDDSMYTDIIEKFKSMGAKDIVITNCIENGSHFNIVYDNKTNNIEKIYFENNERNFIGTGDVFSATLLSHLLQGNNLINSVKFASNYISKLLKNNFDNNDTFDLIIENSLDLLKK